MNSTNVEFSAQQACTNLSERFYLATVSARTGGAAGSSALAGSVAASAAVAAAAPAAGSVGAASGAASLAAAASAAASAVTRRRSVMLFRRQEPASTFFEVD